MRGLVYAIAVGLVFAGCSMTYSQTDVVVIPGNESDEQKLAAAEAIGRELWNGPLKPYILQSVPGVSAGDLDAGAQNHDSAVTLAEGGQTDPVTGATLIGIAVATPNHSLNRTARRRRLRAVPSQPVSLVR